MEKTDEKRETDREERKEKRREEPRENERERSLRYFSSFSYTTLEVDKQYKKHSNGVCVCVCVYTEN